MRIVKYFHFIFYIIFFFIIFPTVFQLTPIQGGDYISPEQQQLDYWLFHSFSSWDTRFQLGWNVLPLVHYAPFGIIIGSIGLLAQNNPIITERLVWWIPYLIGGFFSIRSLFKYIFPNHSSFLAPLIFLTNTYILMILGGGQIAGIGIAYALSPYFLLQFLKLIDISFSEEDTPRLSQSLYAALIATVFFVIELRTTYILFIVVFFYWLYKFFLQKKVLSRQFPFFSRAFLMSVLYVFVIPLALIISMHLFWIFPMLLLQGSPISQLGEIYTSSGSVSFFSFAKSEDTLSLLHPNWPENLFGKTYFMRPEFLLLPIVAFSSLLLLKQKDNNASEQKKILFFALLGLLGAFLSKGTNEPFGSSYTWLFDTVPGFIMFRDPTKFYIFVALAYALLIPFTLQSVCSYFVKKMQRVYLKEYLLPIFSSLFLLFWLFTIRHAVMHELSGTFVPHPVTESYLQLRTFLEKDKAFSRTLWIPKEQRYRSVSETHPAIFADRMFPASSVAELVDQVNKSKSSLQRAGVKYIIVPDDVDADFFVEDRKYDDRKYQATIASVSAIPWLTQKETFGKIAIFEAPDPSDRFMLNNARNALDWTYVSPVHYQIKPKNGTIDGQLFFSERFDPNWVAYSNGKTVPAEQCEEFFNCFTLEKTNYVDIYYQPQKWVNIGLFLSGCTFILVLISLILLKRKERNV